MWFDFFSWTMLAVCVRHRTFLNAPIVKRGDCTGYTSMQQSWCDNNGGIFYAGLNVYESSHILFKEMVCAAEFNIDFILGNAMRVELGRQH